VGWETNAWEGLLGTRGRIPPRAERVMKRGSARHPPEAPSQVIEAWDVDGTAAVAPQPVAQPAPRPPNLRRRHVACERVVLCRATGRGGGCDTVTLCFAYRVIAAAAAARRLLVVLLLSPRLATARRRRSCVHCAAPMGHSRIMRTSISARRCIKVNESQSRHLR